MELENLRPGPRDSDLSSSTGAEAEPPAPQAVFGDPKVSPTLAKAGLSQKAFHNAAMDF